ncbi:uncharacterized protein LOC143207946 [Lasioglossum baleicum]|uniref:uncharacterized protein LOC143207946 n=1 Tax=Lasioglossum baleicum TaxID=434251 RepID=UPI003FCE3618
MLHRKMPANNSHSKDESRILSRSECKRRPKKTYLSVNEKNFVLNVYNKEKEKNPDKNIDEIVDATAAITGISKRSIYRIRSEAGAGVIASPKKKKPRLRVTEKIDDFDKNAIRRIVHQFVFRGKLPTIRNVLEEVNADSTLPDFKKSSFHKLLTDMNIKFERHGRNSFLNDSDEIIDATADTTGVSKRSIYQTHSEAGAEEIVSPKKKKPEEIDDFDKNAIRRIIHQFFFRGELPTICKVLEEVNADSTLPDFKKSSFHKLLRNMNIKFERHGQNRFLNDSDEVVVWRRSFLRQLREFRVDNRPIYYLDETCMDVNITSARSAFLKNPSGKEKRLIIAHIGSDEGFVQDSLWVFESKKSVNSYEMNSSSFEEWFTKILDKLKSNAVVVMDSAPYHSRELDRIPNATWKKEDIKNWLCSKDIPFSEDMVKIELLLKVKQQNMKPTYAVDEIAKEKNITVLRLPPYHDELNPIELIWAQVKNYVVTNNKTLKFQDMKILFHEAIDRVTVENWKKCIEHIATKVETKFWEIDSVVEDMVEPLITNLNDSDSDSELTV